MTNPEYTERLINSALKEHSQRAISVRWDGNYPDPEDTANFDVHLGDDETKYVVWSHGSDLDVAERIGKQAYSNLDGSRSHEIVARIIIDIIEADIKSGKLGEEA
jgi:hypothetical protein